MARRRLVAPGLAFGLAAAIVITCRVGLATSAVSDRLVLERLPGVFRAPVYITAPLGEPNRLYVVEQNGLVVTLRSGGSKPAPFLDLRPVVRDKDLAGLLSIAFPRDYERSRRLYVDYVGRDEAIHVVEFRSRGLHVGRSSARELLRVPIATTRADNHYGGQLAFGPDGRLYVGVGDGRVPGAAQDPASLLGKLLRIDVRSAEPQPEIVAYGLRNPWRFSFDAANGDLYVADVGADTWEEIDYVRHGTRLPVNFGWPAYGGRTRTEEPPPAGAGPLTMPILTYRHRRGRCSAVVGGYVYHGALTAFRGRYLFGDFCAGRISSLRIAGVRATAVRHEADLGDLLSSFGRDSRGELYVCAYSTGRIYRIDATN